MAPTMLHSTLFSSALCAVACLVLGAAPTKGAAQSAPAGVAVTITPIPASPSATPALPPVPPHLVVSADGNYVLDLRSRLIWPRCVEGMRWTGSTCIGFRMLFEYADAVELAAARSPAPGVRWRLPRVSELRHLVDKYSKPPGLHPGLFPQAPTDLHWTSTPSIQHSPGNQYDYANISQGRTGEGGSTLSPLLGWAFNPQTGEATGDLPKTTPLAVRLVRSFD